MTQRRYVVVVASLAITLVAAAAHASLTGRVHGQIAWKGFPRPGNETTAAIYTANPDGSHRRRLTHTAGVVDDLPDWSPDGSTIIFERLFRPTSNQPTVADELMRMNADGSGLRQIGSCTDACVGNDEPQYSPDGRQIVFTRAFHVRGTSALAASVWLMNSDGTHPHVISAAIAGVSEDHEPAWSPDSRNIVFTRLNDSARPANHQALFITPSNGGKARQITPWSLNAGGANWSPDKSTLVFQSYRDCSCTQISQVFTVAPDGSRLTKLTSAGRNIEPNWSPDSSQIIYAHQPGIGPLQLADLWTMDANGTHKHPLVQTKLWESEPDWGTAAHR